MGSDDEQAPKVRNRMDQKVWDFLTAVTALLMSGKRRIRERPGKLLHGHRSLMGTSSHVSLSRLAMNQPTALEFDDHSMDDRRRDFEVAVHIGLGGRAAMKLGVRVDERQVLALKLGVGGGDRDAIRRMILFRVGGTYEHTVPGDVVRPEGRR